MKAFVLVCLMVVLQTVSAVHEDDPGDDHEDRGRKCGRPLSQVDSNDLGVVFTENSITMRRLKEKNCGLARGLECGVPDEVMRGPEDEMRGKKGGEGDHEGAGGRNGTDREGGHGGGMGGPPPGEGGGPGDNGGQRGDNGKADMRPKPERPGTSRDDGTKLCKRIGKLTEFYIAVIERLDDQRIVENSTMDIMLSQDAGDVTATHDTAIPYSHSESDPDIPIKGTYSTVTVSVEGREENTTAKGKLHVYISAGRGNISVDNDLTTMKKGDVKVDLEINDVANWLCFADDSRCASYLRIKFALQVERKVKFNKKEGKTCKDDANRNCGQRVENDDGSSMDVPNKCRKDGQSVTLVGEDGSVSIDEEERIVMDIKRFMTNLYIDPTLSASNTEEDFSGDETSNVGKLASSVLSLLVFVVLALLFTH